MCTFRFRPFAVDVVIVLLIHLVWNSWHIFRCILKIIVFTTAIVCCFQCFVVAFIFHAMLGYLFECQCNSFLSVIHPLPLNTTVMAIFEIYSISFTFFVRFISWSQYSQKEYLDKSRSNAIDKANFIWHVFYNNAGSSFNDSSFIA